MALDLFGEYTTPTYEEEVEVEQIIEEIKFPLLPWFELYIAETLDQKNVSE